MSQITDNILSLLNFKNRLKRLEHYPTYDADINDTNINKSKYKYISKSRNLNISGNSTIIASGAGAFNLGDISDTVANTVNQLPNFDNKSNKLKLKELLNQLKNAVLKEDLDEKETE